MTDEIIGRVLTYVEYELDYFRATRFDYVVNGDFPLYWSLSNGLTNLSVAGVLDADYPSGKGIEVDANATPNDGIVIFDPVPLVDDVTTLALVKRTSGNLQVGIALRMLVNGPSDFDGYFAVFNGPAELSLIKVEGGTVFTEIAAITFPTDTDQAYWLRADVITITGGSVLLRAKAWIGEAGDEPAFFQVSGEDTSSPFLHDGQYGLFVQDGTHSFSCGYFRVRAFFGAQTQLSRHVTPSTFVPAVPYAVPDLIGVTTTPTELSLGENLGRRAQVTLSFRDHPEADFGEGYDSGTKYGKLRGKDLFRKGRALRVINTLEGFEFYDATNEQFNVTVEVNDIRHYVLESFDGPTREGGFSIVAQDLLKLADNDRAQCPVSSNGFLANDVAAAAGSFTVQPAGVGDLEYPAAGFVAVGGKEIMEFTRVGDTFTVTRAQFNTEAQDHESEDRVQLCQFYDSLNAADILIGLLQDFAGINGDFITSVDWQAEVAAFLPFLYTRLIAEPTGVNQLITEMIQQAGLILWADPVENLIKLKVITSRPQVFDFDQTNIDQNTLQIREQPNKQITQVWTYYGVRNPLEPLDEPTNYRSSLATIDSETESQIDQSMIKKIFATWIPTFGRPAAERVNDLNIGRFSKPPRRFTFDVLRHSGVRDPGYAEVYGLSWWGNQDELGVERQATVQVVKVEPNMDRFRVDAEEIFPSSLLDSDLNTNRVIQIDSNVNNLDLFQLHNSIYPEVTDEDLAGTNPVTVTFVISTGVNVGSDSTAETAMTLPTGWPVGLEITIINNGRIQGCGGYGGQIDINDPNASDHVDGLPGGDALLVEFPVTIENNGEIFAGGGGGGAGITLNIWGSGGGGSGNVPGAAGILVGVSPPNGIVGDPGTLDAGGQGGNPGGGPVTGGDGGDPGLAGGNGTGSGSGSVNPGFGGASGDAIVGVSNVTFTVVGDIRGPQVG